MLWELSVVDQRYLAVRETLDSGATVTDVASVMGWSFERFVVGWFVAPMWPWARWRIAVRSLTVACIRLSSVVEAMVVALWRAQPGSGPGRF
jgi:hypothetical protein